MIVLGIETSCDETAAAVVERSPDGSGKIRSDIILSQVEDDAVFGGVGPEIAARAHVEALDGVVAAALRKSGLRLSNVDAISSTAGPNLIGGQLGTPPTPQAPAHAPHQRLAATQPLPSHTR